MRRLILFVIFFLSFDTSAQDKYFTCYYNPLLWNNGVFIHLTEQKELIYTIHSVNNNIVPPDELYVYKLKLNGQIIDNCHLFDEDYAFRNASSCYYQGHLYLSGFSINKSDIDEIYPFLLKINPCEEPDFAVQIPPLSLEHIGAGNSVFMGSDHHLHLACSRSLPGNEDWSGFIYKLNSVGTVMDSVIYETANSGWILVYEFQRKQGGSYLIQIRDWSLGFSYTRLLRLDENLQSLDSVDIYNPDPSVTTFFSRLLLEDEDNTIYILATADDNDLSIIKLNENLEVIWIKELFDRAQIGGFIWTKDRNLLISGHTWGTTIEPWKKCLLKLDTAGNLLWQRIWELEDDSFLYSPLDYDGELYLCGSEANAEGKSATLSHTNCMGLFTEPEASFMIEQKPDNSWFFTNTSQYVYPDSIDGGHFLWQFGDGNSSAEENPTHSYTLPGAYWVELTAVVCNDTSRTGTCISLNGLPCDTPWIYTSTSDFTAEFIDKDLPALLTILPNPFDDYFSAIPSAAATSPLHELILYNADGRVVKKVYTHFDEIDMRHLPAGLYFYEAIFSSGLRSKGKLIKLK